MKRRGFLGGLAGILAAGVAPAIVSNPMKIWVPKQVPGLTVQPMFKHIPNLPIMARLSADFDGDTAALIHRTNVRLANQSVEALMEADRVIKAWQFGPNVDWPKSKTIRLPLIHR